MCLAGELTSVGVTDPDHAVPIHIDLDTIHAGNLM